ncbi:hypothetical protein ALT1644_650005 [Alteromonas macleodii]
MEAQFRPWVEFLFSHRKQLPVIELKRWKREPTLLIRIHRWERGLNENFNGLRTRSHPS